jgi:hypothetical protein
MRAVLVEKFSPVKPVQIREVPSPGCHPRDVRVAAVGLGFVDGLKIQGLYQTKDPLPFVPGMEFSGGGRNRRGSVAGSVWRRTDSVLQVRRPCLAGAEATTVLFRDEDHSFSRALLNFLVNRGFLKDLGPKRRYGRS